MDIFTKQTAKTIGPGGTRCPCCNEFRTIGNHGKKLPGLNKLRRSRLKQSMNKMINREIKKNKIVDNYQVACYDSVSLLT